MMWNTNICSGLEYLSLIHIFVTVHVVLGNTQSEPTCSKFHYEEQTLKSVVRLEFQMERLKSTLEEKVEDIETRLESRLQRLRTEIGMEYNINAISYIYN